MSEKTILTFKKLHTWLLTTIYILFGGFLLIGLFFGIKNRFDGIRSSPGEILAGLVLLIAYSIFYLEIERRVVSKNIFTSFRFVSMTALSNFLFSIFIFIILLAMEQNGCIGGLGALGYLILSIFVIAITGFLLTFRIILWGFITNSDLTAKEHATREKKKA